MAGTLRLSNTGTGNGQSTITTAASGDTTYTLPSGGGTFVTTASTEALTVPFASGTAGSPSITFIGDTDTGIYSPGANQVAIATSGNASLYVASDGKVGIGTTGPGGALDVVAGNTSNYAIIANNSNSSGDQNFLQFKASSTIIGDFNRPNGTNDIEFNAGFGAIGFGTGTAGTPSERARIDSSGRLLVGTSSAVGNGLIQVEATGDSIAHIRRNTTSLTSGPALQLRRSYGTSLNTFTAVPTDGNCGYVQFFGSDGSADAIVAQISAAADGQTLASGDNPGRLVFSTTADGAATPTERMIIRQDGTTQIFAVYTATTGAAANVNVDVNGYLTRSTSSIKYKTSVETLEDQYADALLQCRPVWYRSLSEKDNPEWGWWGFIAEEVAEIDPRLVHWKTQEVTFDETGSAVTTDLETPEPEGVQYDRFVPHLLNLIKRQGEAITELQAEVAALKAS